MSHCGAASRRILHALRLRNKEAPHKHDDDGSSVRASGTDGTSIISINLLDHALHALAILSRSCSFISSSTSVRQAAAQAQVVCSVHT